jgi:hypothetical protein
VARSRLIAAGRPRPRHQKARRGDERTGGEHLFERCEISGPRRGDEGVEKTLVIGGTDRPAMLGACPRRSSSRAASAPTVPVPPTIAILILSRPNRASAM